MTVMLGLREIAGKFWVYLFVSQYGKRYTEVTDCSGYDDEVRNFFF